MKIVNLLACLTALFMISQPAEARFDIAPYVSIKSTKSVTPGKKDTENEKIQQRQEYGIRASLSFWRIFKTQLSLGQSVLTTTHKVNDVVDEYGEIDFNQDLNMDTSDPDKEIRLKETQRLGKFSLLLDPSFSVFIMRFKLGVTARQRIIVKEELGQPEQTITDGPTYKPHSGLGFGIRFTPRMYFMAEYELYHYKFPEAEPFERELSVSYNVSI